MEEGNLYEGVKLILLGTLQREVIIEPNEPIKLIEEAGTTFGVLLVHEELLNHQLIETHARYDPACYFSCLREIL